MSMVSSSPNLTPVSRTGPAPLWAPSAAAQAEKARLDGTRNQSRQIEISAADDRAKGGGPAGQMLARYGFTRAAFDPTLFAQILAADDDEPVAPDFAGRKRYAETLADRQLSLPAGEVLDLRI